MLSSRPQLQRQLRPPWMLSSRSLLLVPAGVVSCPRQDLLRLRAGVFLLATLQLHQCLQGLLQHLLHLRLLQGLLLHLRLLQGLLLHLRLLRLLRLLQGLLLGLVVSALSTVAVPSTVPSPFDGMVLQLLDFSRLRLLLSRCAALHHRLLSDG
ncbi:hypothetical protein PVAP13_2KG291734 [Panicum virgatum]|uniref:Uncharacterized protein n=1 Tax=Panicum virgatum TaxID=38727 RepID=A0A8T0W104_PANVG|nr:hypothetical protein PVAP13_2KG291734 [Panicum virgatum]